MALLRPTCLLISEKSTTYTIKWSYTIIWQVRVLKLIFFIDKKIEKIDIIFDIENLLWKSDFL